MIRHNAKTATLDDLESFRRKLYVTAAEIRSVYPLTEKGCRLVMHAIIAEMEAEGLPQISARPLLVPTERVLKKLGQITRAD